MSGEHQPVPGRQYVRRRYTCESCNVTRAIGVPKVSDTWPAHLWLTEEQVKWLTVAAAEFEQLAEEAGIVSSAVDFCDWVAVDALRDTASFSRTRRETAA